MKTWPWGASFSDRTFASRITGIEHFDCKLIPAVGRQRDRAHGFNLSYSLECAQLALPFKVMRHEQTGAILALTTTHQQCSARVDLAARIGVGQ